MSESEEEHLEDENIESEKKSPLGVILIIFAILAVFLGFGLYKNSQNALNNNADATETAEVPDSDIPDFSAQDVEVTNSTVTENPDNASDEDLPGMSEDEGEDTDLSSETGSESFDLSAASTPRILGNPDAPVKISEHSSFTCPACAAFHKTNFKQIKRDYLDTGKAYLVFDDFPRNSYDIFIGAVARCVPDESYFNFVQLLFETQRDWLNDGYKDYVVQNAKLAGASEKDLENCIDNEALYEALAKRQKDAMDNYNVQATPTLVINDNSLVSGLDPYGDIQAVLNEAAPATPAAE